MPAVPRLSGERGETVVIEKQLRDEEVGPGVDLFFEMLQIGFGVRRFDVRLGITRSSDAEVVIATQHRDEFGCMREPAGRRFELRRAFRRVAAQARGRSRCRRALDHRRATQLGT